MFGISSIGNYSNDPYYQFLEQTAEQAGNSTSQNDTASQKNSTPATTDAASNANTANAKSLKDSIKVAIVAAVQSAEKSGNTTDLLSVIRDAVDKTLQDAGIDPTAALNGADAIKLDSSTKNLLTVLYKEAGVEAETQSALAMLENQSGADSASGGLFSLMGNSDSSSSSQDPLGYLFDTQQ
jgi:hypothetical protein